MTLAEPTPVSDGFGAPPRRNGSVRGIDAATQARLDAGLMRGRLPWPVAIYLVCVAVPLWFHLGPLHMSLLRLYLLVIIVPVLVRLLLGHYGRPILTDWLFLGHTIWIGISLSITTPHMMLTQLGSVGMEFLGGYAIARAYIRTPEAFFALCRALILIVLCLTPFVLFETMTGRPLIIELVRRLPGFHSFEIVWLFKPEYRLGLIRAQSVFAHSIHHGLFCSIVFCLGFVALKGVVSDMQRWITAGIVAGVGFLGLSSGAWLAILLQIGLIAWAVVFARMKARWWLLAGLFALAYVVIDLLSNRTPLQVFLTYATFSAHTASWRMIILEWGIANVIGSAEKGIPSSPWVGLGLNSWVRPWFMHSGSMDNFWLVTAVRYGLPGLFLLALGYFLPLLSLMRRDFSTDPVLSQIRLAWVFTFVGLTFTLVTVFVWSTLFSFIFFFFGAGMWLLTAQPQTTAEPSVPKPEPPPSSEPHYTRFPSLAHALPADASLRARRLNDMMPATPSGVAMR